MARSPSRRAFLTAVAAAMFAGAVVAGILYAVDLAAVRGAAERRLSGVLGQPVAIGDLDVSLLPVPSLTGSEIRIGAERREAPAIALDRISLHPRWRTVIQQPIVVREVRLDGLTVSLLHDEAGRWHLPVGIPAPTEGNGGDPVLERVRLREGRVRIVHETGTESPAAVLEGLEAELTTEGNVLRVAPLTGRLVDAPFSGEAEIGPELATLELRSEDVDVGRLLTALTGEAQRLDGRASAILAVSGATGASAVQNLTGRAEVEVADGVVRNFPLLASLNRALRLAAAEGDDTRFERLAATLAVANRAATTDDLILQAADVRVALRGRLGFDRSLDFTGLAIFSAERSAEAIQSIRELETMRNERGEIELPLRITGTVDQPAFRIDVARALGGAISDEIQRRLRDVVRPPGD